MSEQINDLDDVKRLGLVSAPGDFRQRLLDAAHRLELEQSQQVVTTRRLDWGVIGLDHNDLTLIRDLLRDEAMELVLRIPRNTARVRRLFFLAHTFNKLIGQ